MRCWLTVLLLAGCADAGSEPNYCEIGQDAYGEALTSLYAQQKACTRDDECVELSTNVSCNGFSSSSSCKDIVHRDSVSLWKPEEICRELNAYPPAKLTCSTEALCVGAGEPICRSGRCTGTTLVERTLDSGARLDAGRDASGEGG